MRHFVEHVRQSIQSRRLLRNGEKVLVAVSGGLDSMALLDVLGKLAVRHGWRLTIAHLNHRLRGRSSDADERFVIRVARKRGMAVVTERADCRKFARTQKSSIEMAARKARHEFLARTAARLRMQAIALAHHADDQLELFFLRLLRGSGNEGIAGMKWKSPSPYYPKIKLVRPLLDQPKAALLQYVSARHLPFREDASNASFDYQRNRIRHQLLPLLRRSYQPGLDRTISRVMEIAGAESELVGQIAAGWLEGRRRGPFDKLPVAVQRRCIQAQLLKRISSVEYDLVEHLRTKPGQAIKVSPELTVISQASGMLAFQEDRGDFGPELSRRAIRLAGGGGEFVFDDLRICWRLVPGAPHRLSERRPGSEEFDADKIGSRIAVRHWLPGDRMQPIGMASPVKLQDLFTNAGIAREERHTLVVATTGSGELFWVEKLRISERFKLTARTNRRLHWQWKRL